MINGEGGDCEGFSRVFTIAPHLRRLSGYGHGKPTQQKKRQEGRLDRWENVKRRILTIDKSIWMLAKEMGAER
jgi:hypothetical protein